ncbi:MAG: hypothetical protein ACOYL5_06120 [Phototrophicaceae bacterium]|jgi:hypothetical protein
MKIRLLAVALLIALFTAACSTTPTGTSTDANSAANFLPTLNGYTVTNASSITEAITAAAGQGANAFGNPAVVEAIARVDTFIACYTATGSAAANIYTQVDLSSVLSGSLVPSVGAVAVVNNDRVRENLIACATSGDFSAASAPSTCQGNGSFTSGGNTFTYVYISTQQTFCSSVSSHFNGIN